MRNEQENQKAVRRTSSARAFCGSSILRQIAGGALLVWVLSILPVFASVVSIPFSYPDRQSFLADGWSFFGTTATGAPRNTENTTTSGGFVDFDQTAHPGSILLPVDMGDLWAGANNSRNALFRALPQNWVSVQLQVSLAPATNYQQINLQIYQDDDNYAGLGHVFSAGERVLFVREFDRYPFVIGTRGVTLTNSFLRVTRDVTNENLTGSFSIDGTNWIVLGQLSQALINPRICVWAGGATQPWSNGAPVAILWQLQIETKDDYVPPTPALRVQPWDCVFSSVAGASCTNQQQIHIYSSSDQAPPVHWFLTNTTPWLITSTSEGYTPANVSFSVNSAGLPPGVYQGSFSIGAPNALSSTGTVELIVNPAGRAGLSAWRGGRKGALSVSVDDSYATAWDKLLANGFTGTYFLLGILQSPIFSTLYSNGMELASHTADHPCADILTQPMMRFEVETNLLGIFASTPEPPQDCTSFAWPCGLTTPEMDAVVGDYFLSARGYNWNQLEDPSPVDFMNLKSFNSHEHAPYPPADFKTVVDQAVAQGKWFIMVLHSMTNDDDAIPYATTKDIWVAPIGTVVKYIYQRDRTVITDYLEGSNSIQFHCYRLPIVPGTRRAFETAFHASDAVTFTIDLAGASPANQVNVDGVSVPFSINSSNTNLLHFDVLIGAAPKQITISLASDLASQLQIDSIIAADGFATLTWNSISNRIYRVQATDSLNPVNWQDITPNLTATNSIMSFSQPIGFAAQRFFRILLLP